MRQPHPFPPAPQRAFTAVEMLVVMTVLISVMAIGIQGMLGAQRRVDGKSTLNVIQAVHNACMHQARQCGSACLIYGYTLEYTDTASIVGPSAASSMRPWVIVGQSGVAQYDNPPACDLQSNIGEGELWVGDRLVFIDNLRPSASATIDGTSIAAAGAHYLHIAFEPRTGFVHAVMNNSPTASFTTSGAGGITDANSLPNAVSLPIWNLIVSAPNWTYHETHVINVSATGVTDVHMP
jgi:type II secretory pathway pseudopilin PulG